jgi:predicted outer membrane protein
MMMRAIPFALAAALAAAGAGAQPPAEKKADARNAPTGDSRFMMDAATDNMAEVELGRLASEKASRQDVKDYGRMLVADHSNANDELNASRTLPTLEQHLAKAREIAGHKAGAGGHDHH